ncbi:hypothetical protein IFM89_009246 [Coptis chinensis]|uniref:Quinolinate phosphoribosyl transferase N-terminal domain-containing protein n=1 Tax=Coptis chinensis TaxID=261450 RepID=A0A835I971_9MAGN|nr:hypothetical protein IFM89_009246 [Coptis chinensis]
MVRIHMEVVEPHPAIELPRQLSRREVFLDGVSSFFLTKTLMFAINPSMFKGDVTCLATVPIDMKVEAHFFIKEDNIIARISLAEMVFNEVDPSLEVECFKKDGDFVSKGTQFAKVSVFSSLTMACKLKSSLISFFLVLTIFLSMTQFISTAREIQSTMNKNDKSNPNKDAALTTQTLPGIGGQFPTPHLGGGEHSINLPGSHYHQYIPGLDDTFVQNPGTEIPSPHGGRIPAATHP